MAFIGKPAVPHPIPLLNEPDADVRWKAAKTLAKIGASSAAPDLVVAMDDTNFGIRWLAAEGLIAIGIRIFRSASDIHTNPLKNTQNTISFFAKREKKMNLNLT